jgi:hypothetical protein
MSRTKTVFKLTTSCQYKGKDRTLFREWTVLAYDLQSAINLCDFDKKIREQVEEVSKVVEVNIW